MKAYYLIPLLLLTAGCPKDVLGPTQSEPAEVYDTCFVPSGHGQTSGAWGYGHDGGVYTPPQDITIPATYAVVFKCQHGKFVIDGPRGEVLYKKLEKGDSVIVTYCEELTVDNGVTNHTGLHFIDANRVRE